MIQNSRILKQLQTKHIKLANIITLSIQKFKNITLFIFLEWVEKGIMQKDVIKTAILQYGKGFVSEKNIYKSIKKGIKSTLKFMNFDIYSSAFSTKMIEEIEVGK